MLRSAPSANSLAGTGSTRWVYSMLTLLKRKRADGECYESIIIDMPYRAYFGGVDCQQFSGASLPKGPIAKAMEEVRPFSTTRLFVQLDRDSA